MPSKLPYFMVVFCRYSWRNWLLDPPHESIMYRRMRCLGLKPQPKKFVSGAPRAPAELATPLLRPDVGLDWSWYRKVRTKKDPKGPKRTK